MADSVEQQASSRWSSPEAPRLPCLTIKIDNRPSRGLKDLKPLGYFSLDGDRKVICDASRLMYLYRKYGKFELRDISFDLSRGYEHEGNVRKKPLFSEEEKLDSVLSYLSMNIDKFQKGGSRKLLSTDFVTYRGVLREIMNTIYEKHEGWFINVSYYKGNMYMCASKTEYGATKALSLTDREKLMSAWGMKFEQYLLTSNPELEPDINAPINDNEEFNCAFQAKLGQNKILYAAEMDAIISQTPLDIDEELENVHFIELKTCKHLNSNKQKSLFQRFKSFKFWSQSYLVGIKRIMVGFRDDNGFVDYVETYETDTLPDDAINWNVDAPLNFLNSFLSHVYNVIHAKSNLDDVSPSSVWRFGFQPSSNQINVEYLEGPNTHSFIRDWYIEKTQQISNNAS